MYIKEKIPPTREEIKMRIPVIKKNIEQYCGKMGFEFDRGKFDNLTEDQQYGLGLEHNHYLIRDGEEKAVKMAYNWLKNLNSRLF